MRALGFFALGLVAFASAPQAVSERPEFTPFEPGHSDIVLAARLNGRGPFRFLLDTGSTHTAMSAETAEAIGAPVVAKAAMGSAAGSRETLVVHVKSLEVGSMRVSNLLASVIELAKIPGGSTIDGVIGHDALGALRYTINFRQRRVVAVIDYDAARMQQRVIDLANGALQFSILGGSEDPAQWPAYLDATRFKRFIRGYDEVDIISVAEFQVLPGLMIEAMVAESVLPVATTGSFGRIEGYGFLQMIERKVRWVQANADALVLAIAH